MAKKTLKKGSTNLTGYGSINTTVNGQAVTTSQFSANTTTVPAITVDGDTNVKIRTDGKVTIEDKDGVKYDVVEFMKTVSERLLVLQPNFEAHEKYPALKEAYEHYKMLETLLGVDNDKKD